MLVRLYFYSSNADGWPIFAGSTSSTVNHPKETKPQNFDNFESQFFIFLSKMDTSDQFEHTKTNGFSNGRIDSDERELEELLFGNLNETWDKTGHELSEPESGSGDEEEDDQANEGQDDVNVADSINVCIHLHGFTY